MPEVVVDELEEFDPAAEVRLAFRDAGAFEHSVGSVASVDPTTVYIAGGTQIGYLPGVARREIGWARA